MNKLNIRLLKTNILKTTNSIEQKVARHRQYVKKTAESIVCVNIQEPQNISPKKQKREPQSDAELN